MSQIRYPSKSWVFKGRFYFKGRQHGQQQLYLQYKVCWILYKMVGASSFLQPILWIQLTLQSLPRNSFSSSVNFYLPISPLLFRKIILTIHTNTSFLYNTATFHLLLFAYNNPNNLHQKYFTYLKQFANSGCIKLPGS